MQLSETDGHRLIRSGADHPGSDRTLAGRRLLDHGVSANGKPGIDSKNEHMFGSLGGGRDTTKDAGITAQSTTQPDEVIRMCTEDCGRLQPPDEQELIEAFRMVTHDAFAFLTPAHQLKPAPPMYFRLEGDERHATVAADVVYPFLVVLEYTGGANPPVRLSYGRRDYQLELEIGANGTGFHPLQSWLEVLAVDDPMGINTGVATPPALARHGRRLARALRRNFSTIASADHAAIQRLPARTAAAPASVNEMRDRATAAFTAGDYRTVIDLLAPFEAALTATERRRLEFARRAA